MIKVSDVSKKLFDKQTLSNISFDLPTGAILALVGANGEGKTTLLKILAGILKADKGEVLLDDEKVYDNPKAKRQIFFVPTEYHYTNETTAFSLANQFRHQFEFDKDIYLCWLDKFNITKDHLIRRMSRGMKKSVMIALSFAMKPKVLLMDEPFDGLDPSAKLTFRKGLISFINDNHSTVIISGHTLDDLQNVCDYYALINQSNLDGFGKLDDTLQNVHRFQLAFDKELSKDDFKLDYLSLDISGKIVKIALLGDINEITKKLKDLKPLVLEHMPIDFDEYFNVKVGKKHD